MPRRPCPRGERRPASSSARRLRSVIAEARQDADVDVDPRYGHVGPPPTPPGAVPSSTAARPAPPPAADAPATTVLPAGGEPASSSSGSAPADPGLVTVGAARRHRPRPGTGSLRTRRHPVGRAGRRRRRPSTSVYERCLDLRRGVRRHRRRARGRRRRARRGALRRARLAAGGRAHGRAAAGRRPASSVESTPALSFPTWRGPRLGVDPLAGGVRLVDGHRFAVEAAGERGPAAGRPVRPPRRAVRHQAGGRGRRPSAAGRGAAAPRPARRARWSRWPGTTSTAWSSPTTSPRCGSPSWPRRWRPSWCASPSWCAPCGPAARGTASRPTPSLTPPPPRGDLRGARGHRRARRRGAARATTHLEEELGDLLFQVVFHATLAAEAGQFTLADVARGIHDKLVAPPPPRVRRRRRPTRPTR